jgi:hypothetical protein
MCSCPRRSLNSQSHSHSIMQPLSRSSARLRDHGVLDVAALSTPQKRVRPLPRDR